MKGVKMSEKRKDSNGRILKDGEHQRSNGTYNYRYVDCKGKKRDIYAKTLTELRTKEKNIQRDITDGIDPAAGEIIVSDLVAKYMNLKRDFSPNTQRAYSTVFNRIKSSYFGDLKIKNVKISTAKEFYIYLHDTGIRRNTISTYHNVLRPAFEMAVDDDMIRKNPFKFQLSDLLRDDSVKRDALTPAQQEEYLNFIRDNGSGNYYDDIVILLGTGLRVSELYGLTKNDIDLNKRIINVNHQLCRTADKPYFVKNPKTSSGKRCIPMSNDVYNAFVHVIANRKIPQVEMFIDGYTGFLFLDKNGLPKVAMNLQGYMKNMQNKYEKMTGNILPPITPHVLRHTFCTNMQRAGIDVKSLQYLMGHSNVSVTLDVYTHTNFESVREAFAAAASNM